MRILQVGMSALYNPKSDQIPAWTWELGTKILPLAVVRLPVVSYLRGGGIFLSASPSKLAM